MSEFISVVLCTHNPRPAYLERVMAALRDQTLPRSSWELLIVDNRSDQPLETQVDLSWHEDARCVREEILGLSHARCRGIRESKGEIMVFVDDDNVLESDYLEQALLISQQQPRAGVWCGQSKPVFETPPPDWAQPFLPYLALREFDQDTFMMERDMTQPLPYGAGMCVRRVVAAAFAQAYQQESWRSLLGRQGSSLMSGEDTDLGLLSLEMGWGIGSFFRLRLEHLIPSSRLTREYLLRLTEASSASSCLISCFHGESKQSPSRLRLALRYLRYWLIPGGMQRNFMLSVIAGEWRACGILSQLGFRGMPSI